MTNNYSKVCNQHPDQRCGNFFSELLEPRDSSVGKVVQVTQRPHHPRSAGDSRPTSASTQEDQENAQSQSWCCHGVTLGLCSFSVLPFSFVGENTGFLPQKGQAEVSLTRGPGSTLLLSCMEHPVLISPCGFLLSEPAAGSSENTDTHRPVSSVVRGHTEVSSLFIRKQCCSSLCSRHK